MELSEMPIDFNDSENFTGTSFLPIQNVSAFGFPSEISELNLPNNRDVLKYYFYLSECQNSMKRSLSYESFSPQVAKKIIEIWTKLNVEIINEKSVVKKLNGLLNNYHRAIKNKARPHIFSEFLKTLNNLLYIGKRQCVKTIPCCCGLIPDHLKEFLIDQHTARKLTIPECVLSIVDQQSTEPALSLDPSYNPSNMNVESDVEIAMPSTSEETLVQKIPYTKKYNTLNFAMMCDRFGISDIAASCLATALFSDIGFQDENGEPIIMDKSKVARERIKSREYVRGRKSNESNLVAFSFDGRKNNALTMETISGRYHPRMEKESHIVVLKEPGSQLLGYIKVGAENANTKQNQLCEFFKEKKLSLTNMIGICCDGEPTNTGVENGIIRRFEILLDKPLHWFVCLLHFNELPFRHLFNTLEMSTTSGPRTSSGTLTKLIKTCEQLPDVKMVETELEEYATKTIEDVSSYFLQLHSFLQNEEKKVVDLFREMSQQPQFQLRQAYVKLNESLEMLNAMRANLLVFKENPPTNIHVGHVLEKYDEQLGQLPCQLHITKPLCNPFHFEGKQQEICREMAKYFEYDYEDPKIKLFIQKSNDDSNQSIMDISSLQSSMDISSNATLANANAERQQVRQNQHQNTKSKAKNIPQQKSNLRLSNINSPIEDIKPMAVTPVSPENEENLVRVTYTKSPEHFYVQKASSLQKIRELSNTYLNHGQGERITRIVSEGYYYMTYYAKDKQWYRSILKKILPNDLYKVFLVDFGMHLEISRDKLCDIDQTHLNIPFAAVRCAIHDIVPAGSQWNEAANNLMLELLNNNPARMVVSERISNELLKIDLQTTETKSVRDSFLYVGLAREQPGVISFKMQPKTISSGERIPKNNLRAGEILMVSMLHVDGPQKFYVIKRDQIEEKRNFIGDLNMRYGSKEAKIRQIFLGSVQMFCAVCIDEIWHRAVIEEIKERGTLAVRLIDEGRRELITWRQAYVLQDEFRNISEFAILCSLTDIEPLQDNSYVYTSTAINDFKQMTINPCLRMEVIGIKDNGYRVVLYVSKRSLDINIAAALVKNNHGMSTGGTTQTMELPKVSKRLQNDGKPEDGEIRKTALRKHDPISTRSSVYTDDFVKSPSVSLLAFQRTPITVSYLVNPGEFYIQLTNLRQGTKAFHSQIQEQQNRKYSSMESYVASSTMENRDWFVNDHCLVYSSYENSAMLTSTPRECEWYRGIIHDVSIRQHEEPIYSVFLRDIGATIQSSRYQLFPIDGQLDRVTNAVYCCHLACIEPTGGKTWSHSAVDWFRHSVDTSESLSVSMYGKHSADRPSFPVIMWGSITETADPLAPCITKYSNINRSLAKSGLAYMAEPLDAAKQFDRIEEMEISEGEITLEQWFQLFQDKVLPSAIKCSTLHPRDLANFTMDESCEGGNNDDSESHPLSIHLKEFDVTPTTGRNKPPPAWETSKDINKTIFNGYPTYLDYKCIVYLHEADDKPFLEAMSSIISKNFINIPQPDADYKYTIGQPVIARYHLDGNCYRAVINTVELNADGELDVFFIDYGNIDGIEPEHIRPCAPFPKLPSIANKFRLSGIQPKNCAREYIQDDLDQMHLEIVTKLVSVRLPLSELNNTIKMCSMRLGTEDVASNFIEKRWAVKAEMPPPTSSPTFFLKPAASAPSNVKKGRNPLPSNLDFDFDYTETDYDVFDKKDGIEDNHKVSEQRPLNYNCGGLSEETMEYDHINNLIERLDENYGNLDCIPSQTATNHSIFQQSQTLPTMPLSKKRMFGDNDYTQLVNGIMAFDSDGLHSHCADDNSLDHDDDDIVELDHRFSMNYWHTVDVDMGEEETTEIVQQLDRRIQMQDDGDMMSEFENFRPNNTSTVISHFSEIDFFKMPQWPFGLTTFTCRVVSVITPTVLQIFPIHSEFEHREVELQRHIKHTVKSAPPLTHFETRTICLACYSKDKKWYRALIRSHNKIAKTVEVLYVDYLNSETLAMKYVRECPPDVLGWPLRTFRVRLHGVKANPRIRDHDIRLALQKQLSRQNLYAVVKKPASSRTNCTDAEEVFAIRRGGPIIAMTDYSDLMQISLFKSEELSVNKITAYDTLIKSTYFLRT